MDEADARRFVAAKRKRGLSDETVAILLELHTGGPLAQRQLGERISIPFDTLRRHTARLEKSRHIESKPSDGDARIPVFELTDHGRRLVKAIVPPAKKTAAA